MYHFYHVLAPVCVRAPTRARKNLPNFLQDNDLCRFPLEIRLRFYCTAVPIITQGYQSSNFRTLSSDFPKTDFNMSCIITLSQLDWISRLTNIARKIALSCMSQGFIKSALIISSLREEISVCAAFFVSELKRVMSYSCNSCNKRLNFCLFLSPFPQTFRSLVSL